MIGEFPEAVILPIAEEYADPTKLAPIEVRLDGARKFMRAQMQIFPDNPALQTTLTTVLQMLREPDLKQSTTNN